MPEYVFDRESRTPSSEVYAIVVAGAEIGRVDLHWTAGRCDATLCVPEHYADEQIEELIGEIDERLVLSADPYREDFIVTVWAGRHAGTYSEEALEAEEALDEGEEVEGNGHRL